MRKPVAAIYLSGLLCLSDCIFTSDVCRSNIYCFECNSKDTPTCGDPFNRSEYGTVPLNRCHGCCMKLVRWKNTPEEVVYRMCSGNRNLEIDQSLIDHVCLKEWKGMGTLCFCEHDRCNSASSNHHFYPPRIPAHRQHESTIGLQFLWLFLTVLIYPLFSLSTTRIFGYRSSS